MYARFQKLCYILLIVSILIPSRVRAASGLPGSALFGYGGRVDLWGRNPQRAIIEAGNFNLDWVAVDFAWSRLQPEAAQPPQWTSLDQAIQEAETAGVGVMVSLTQAPSWAMGENGPDPQKTAELASTLVRRYPEALLALELFPFANTGQGWGRQPDPQAYAALLQTTAQSLRSANPEISLIAGGISPVTTSIQDMDDIEFLNQLYRFGAAEGMPVLGVRLPPLGSDPLAPTDETEKVVLRHYEEIRNVMIENGHKNGLIWITGFSWDAAALSNQKDQAAWLKQAYLLFRSQLYIGAAFFDGLNASAKVPAALLLQKGFHPGFEELIQVIAQDHDSQTIWISRDLSKKLIRRNYLKGS